MGVSLYYVVKDDIIVSTCNSLEFACKIVEELKQTEKIAKLLKHKLFKRMLKKGYFSVATSDYKILVDTCVLPGNLKAEEDSEDDF